METTLYKIKFSDGRLFKVFCANKNQKERLITSVRKSKDYFIDIKSSENGIHNIKQWEDIISNEPIQEKDIIRNGDGDEVEQ